MSYNLFVQEIPNTNPGTMETMPRYAWLEYEDGMWHFLTDLFAEPEESSRSWRRKDHALQELAREGWSVVSPYPEMVSEKGSSQSRISGYGLMWIGD